MAPRALVKNASDPEQVQRAGRKVVNRRADELADLNAVLATPAGGRVLWRFLHYCRVFESVQDPPERIQANAGRQDVGHWLMAEIEAADDLALFRLMQDARRRAKSEDLENAAAQTPTAMIE